MENNRTEISEIGEFGLIDRIRTLVDVPDAPAGGNLILGIADDTAVYRPTPGKVQLLTTDAFVEGVHFDLTFTSMKHLGWKVMAANLSDIAAMCGVPRYAAITLALPRKISVEMVEELYSGIVAAAGAYGCLIVGGDTTTSLGNTVISAALTGEADEDRVVYRKGARTGDYLCVTGHLGASHAGLKVLQREKQRFAASPDEFRPDLEPYALAISKHLMPKPRLDISGILGEAATVDAMIDISDGLASEVHHLCRGSGVGAAVYEHNLPIEGITGRIAGEFSETPADYALFGGEEYELLFAISENEHEKLSSLTSDVTIIGRVTEAGKGIELIRENGEHQALPFSGWNHFRR